MRNYNRHALQGPKSQYKMLFCIIKPSARKKQQFLTQQKQLTDIQRHTFFLFVFDFINKWLNFFLHCLKMMKMDC